MKSLFKIACVVVALFTVAATAHAQSFGYVNSSALLAEMPEVKQADANLEALQKQLQKKGQGMLEQLQNDYVAIQTKVERGELSPKQQEEEAQKLKGRETEIAQFEQDMIKQIQDKRESLLKPIYDKVNQAIKEVADSKGFQFVFDQTILLYAAESQDISAEVRAKLGI